MKLHDILLTICSCSCLECIEASYDNYHYAVCICKVSVLFGGGFCTPATSYGTLHVRPLIVGCQCDKEVWKATIRHKSSEVEAEGLPVLGRAGYVTGYLCTVHLVWVGS